MERYGLSLVELKKNGSFADAAAARSVVAVLAADAPTDVIVLVHGWNNDMDQARSLYRRLIGCLESVERGAGSAPGDPRVVGVLWPSIQWADESQVAGGGAGVASPADELRRAIVARVEDAALAQKLAALVPQLDGSAAARAEYLRGLRTLLSPESGDPDVVPPTLVTGSADTVFERASALVGGGEGRAGGGAANGAAAGGGAGPGGGAAGLNLGGFVRRGRSLLNTFSYFQMRARSGDAGSVGVAGLLADLAGEIPGARLHLVGHSFGARAATAAASAATVPIASLTLLQAAFSHYALAENWKDGQDGIFHRVPSRLTGPLIVTHTRKDRAVGLAYALISRIAGQVAVGVGDRDDPYGGLGSNGALKTPSASFSDLLAPGGTYSFLPKHVHNLKGDPFISGHGAIDNDAVAYALWRAMALGS
ncbi:hypothetical protein [Cryptosporangium sp. NPDC051539]|uniref:hypothetical protein n=1 Tax=Cryptosporangium sp. NPDC051539 TaxID=3363962 RepID=UPI0037A49228